MKKLIIVSIVTLMLSSCAVGTYMPSALNNYGTQTQVVLSGANFRIVRDVEVVIEVDNSNLKRQDVERSAYGELLRQYKLTGSQAFINVSIEEVRRESAGFFRALFVGVPKVKQYVAARATIIEFLQPNGEPIKSVETPYTKSVESTPVTMVEEPAKQNTKTVENTSVTKIEEPAKQLTPEEQEQANYYYLAYLYKTGKLNIRKLDKTIAIDFKRIKETANSNTIKDLLIKRQGYDVSLNKYNMNLYPL